MYNTNNFEGIIDFCEEIEERFESGFRRDLDDYKGISVVGHYDVMIQIFDCLVACSGFTPYSIELTPPEIDNYDDEWVLTIDCETNIWIRKAKYGEKYIRNEADISFVHVDVNTAYIKEENSNRVAVFAIEELGDWGDEDEEFENECSCGCEHCDCKDKKVEVDEDCHGFTVSHISDGVAVSHSFYSSDELDSDVITGLIKKLGW